MFIPSAATSHLCSICAPTHPLLFVPEVSQLSPALALIEWLGQV